MRPLLSIVISAFILLGVRAYLGFAASLREARVLHYVAREEEAATGRFSAEITLTFDCQADEFSLEPTSLVLKHQGKELLKREGIVAAGEPIMIENIAGITAGKNEFYFECVPKDDGKALARAVRVRVLRDGVSVADQTLWSPPGQTPRGAIVVDVAPSPRGRGPG
jgi:hypothetical protein